LQTNLEFARGVPKRRFPKEPVERMSLESGVERKSSLQEQKEDSK